MSARSQESRTASQATVATEEPNIHASSSTSMEDTNNNDGMENPVQMDTGKTHSQKTRSKVVSERGEDDMYPMTKLNFKQRDVKKRYKGVVGPLSLFAPFPHEEVKVVDERIEMERPVTPIDEEIKIQPLHFTQLAKYIRRRLAAKAEVEHLSIDEQQGLAGILMGEVNSIWPDIRRQIDDPFLTPDDNKELNRRIAVHIVTVCEQLFKHYINKAQILNKRGVFSGPANMSRLKAQLALDANKFLNVLMIRRYIVSDIRGKIDSDTYGESDKDFIYDRKPPPKPETEGLTYKALIQQSRPKSKTKKYRFRTVEEDLEELSHEMPSLDTRKLTSLVQNLPTPRPESVEEILVTGQDKMSEHGSTSAESEAYVFIDTLLCDSDDEYDFHHHFHDRNQLRCIVVDRKNHKTANNTRRTSALIRFLGMDYYESIQRLLLKRSKSLPELQHETLAEELDLSLPPKENHEIIEGVDVYTLDIRERGKKKEKDEDSRDFIQDDLCKLLDRQVGDTHSKDVDDELPPLIQAILTHARHDERKTVLDNQLKSLEKTEQEEKVKQEIPLQRPTHPQPATVPSKLPNKMTLRASDVRVSERVCMSSMTISKTATVYNDLLDDITPASIKQLDSNLFLGSEVKEVYEEIMKTVPTDHLDLEVAPHFTGIPLHKSDNTIEPSAQTVNLQSAIASSTLLNSKKKNRIVNKDIQKKEEAPWTGEDIREWARTNISQTAPSGSGQSPQSPLKDTRGGVAVTPMTPTVANINAANDGKFIPGVGNLEDLPVMVAERMSRSYNSWLQWWKNTVNYDDYLKYLSNKETDYLAAVFHFYNSEDEEEEDERSPSVVQKMKEEEDMRLQRQKKLVELRTQKAEFTPGLWNVNAVLLGGLGKDPDTGLEEDTEKVDDAPATEMMQKKKKTLQDVITEKLQDRITDQEADWITNQGPSRLSQSVGYTRPPLSAKTVTTVTQQDTSSPQEKLERIWSALKMPDGQKLDMAIKYSSDEFTSVLEQAIEGWQKATEVIVAREELMTELERFERLASDPNRFFERGFRGSSVARLEEAKHRSMLYRKIEALSIEVKRAVKFVEDTYKDQMTYQGRPYLDKMQWDRTEMLYWLSEERRTQALEHEAMLRDVALNVVQLAPLSTH